MKENAMKLRTVTIGTIWLMMIVTTAPYVYLFTKIFDMYPVILFFDFCVVGILWLSGSSPLVVSWILLRFQKHHVSLIILLVSTIVYGVWYGYAWYLSFDRECCMSELWLLYIAPISLYWMVPAWILAWSINSFYVKKASANPGTALRSVIDSLDENHNEDMQ
jgi:hypothetical protein